MTESDLRVRHSPEIAAELIVGIKIAPDSFFPVRVEHGNGKVSHYSKDDLIRIIRDNMKSK